MNDEDLIRRFIIQDDKKAFEILVRRKLPTLRRIVAAAGPRSPEDRDDLLQEVLIKLHRALVHYRFDAPLNTWIFRITRNAALDEEKKRRRAQARDLKAGTREVIHRSTAENPEEMTLAGERTRELRELFYQLPEPDRQLLLLREKEGLSMEEMGSILGLSTGTVKSRLSRARRRARKLYEEAS